MPLEEGQRVSFFAYSDGDGIGAEDVWLEESDAEMTLREGDLEDQDASSTPRASGWRAPLRPVAAGRGVGVRRTIEKRADRSSSDVLAKFVGSPSSNVNGSAAVVVAGKGKGKSKAKERNRPVALFPGARPGADRNKTTESGAGSVLRWFCSEMRGWRPAMEDASLALLGLSDPLASYAMFAVFDGHGGAEVSRRAAAELPQDVLAAAAAAGDGEGDVAEHALRAALPALDARIRSSGDGGQPSFRPTSVNGLAVSLDVTNSYSLMGSTAVVALLECDGSPQESRPSRVVVANIGDSRAILCRAGEAIALSEDHKPDDQEERERIEKAGGFVGAVGPCMRIDGWGLNLSRALGDYHYKARSDLSPGEQKVSVVPDIRSAAITEQDEFLLLCCDGVFELHSSQEAVDHVRQKLLAKVDPAEAIESLVDASCSEDPMLTQGRGSDNVTAMVVLLRDFA